MPGLLKGNIRLKWFELSIIILFWVLLFASPLLMEQSTSGTDWKHVFKVWKEHSVLLVIFLANRFLLVPFILFRNRQVLYILSASFMISVAATGMYLYDKSTRSGIERKPPETSLSSNYREVRPGTPPPRREDRPAPKDPSRPEPVPAYVNLMILSLLVFGFDTGLKISSKWVESEQLRISLEKENIETQLAFLKHQISPHFFMNTLNNIHSLIDVDTSEAKKSVIKLSGLMRHLLYESDHALSPLKNEVDFIRSYVDLMKLRYSDNVRITLNIPDKLPDKSIPPLLFISLLENAFKHGISYLQESFINIELTLKADKLQLLITNSKSKKSREISEAGIGIENTRKRLDLLYKDKYTLDVTDRENVFITNLIITV